MNDSPKVQDKTKEIQKSRSGQPGANTNLNYQEMKNSLHLFFSLVSSPGL